MKRLPWCVYCELVAYPVYLAVHLIQVHDVPDGSAIVIAEAFKRLAERP